MNREMTIDDGPARLRSTELAARPDASMAVPAIPRDAVRRFDKVIV